LRSTNPNVAALTNLVTERVNAVSAFAIIGNMVSSLAVQGKPEVEGAYDRSLAKFIAVYSK